MAELGEALGGAKLLGALGELAGRARLGLSADADLRDAAIDLTTLVAGLAAEARSQLIQSWVSPPRST